MQAVILAGGLATRLRPLSERIPKAMVLINGRPFLWHLLELLKARGIGDFVLCVGYLGEQISDYLGDGGGMGISIHYSWEREGLLGTGGALKQAEPLLEERFFVINGDTYLPIDYRKVEERFLRGGKGALMVVYDNREDTGVRNSVALDSDGMVIIHDKEGFSDNLKYVDAGVLALKREALAFLHEGKSISLEEGLYPFLMERREMGSYIVEQRFYDIGTPEQLKAFEAFLKGGGG